MKTRSSPSKEKITEDAPPRVTRESILRKLSATTAGPEPERETPPRLVAELSAKSLVNNYHSIRELAGDQEILPMIKANGYGHGATWVARCLLNLPGLAGFGVVTLAEGRDLRQALAERGGRTTIVVFAGAAPWTEEKGYFCEKWQLTPVIASFEDFEAFIRQGWPARLGYQLKFNTGMNRLGIAYSRVAQIRKILTTLPSGSLPSGILSHLAVADDPEHRLSLNQRDRFQAIRTELTGILPHARFHLANSAALWRSKNWGLDRLSDLVRPGLALYGLPPWPSAPLRGLVPVLTLRAQIIFIHELSAGETVGYGATYRVKERARVGVVSIGYADGLHRHLGIEPGEKKSVGTFVYSGQSLPILGRISMDQTTIEVPKSARVGDWVEILGPTTDAWAMAQAADTIPYELFTSLSSRVERKHV